MGRLEDNFGVLAPLRGGSHEGDGRSELQIDRQIVVLVIQYVNIVLLFQEYKPPTALDIPADLRVILLPNAKNPYGVLGSKGRVLNRGVKFMAHGLNVAHEMVITSVLYICFLPFLALMVTSTMRIGPQRILSLTPRVQKFFLMEVDDTAFSLTSIDVKSSATWTTSSKIQTFQDLSVKHLWFSVFPSYYNIDLCRSAF